uniref:Trafficking protein particle complex subunit 8 n=1 Tax=Syphacia muris TaxID=451379 RepID=A0A0N5AMP5_9BILA
MVEEEVRRGFGPLIAVLSSDGAERVSAKNNLTFAEILLPFSTVEATVKDPSGTAVSTKICYDIRDIRHEGFLLTLTVLPSVLHESVHTVTSTSDATNVFKLSFTYFKETLLRWAEPPEHEFLRTYIACLFAVSTEDADPLAELSQLIQMQHSQQHGVSSATIGPAYCVHPKWMLPNTYKYYVLIHDIMSGSEDRFKLLFVAFFRKFSLKFLEVFSTAGIFKSMTSIYGAENCYLLRLNSAVNDCNLTDIWKDELDRKNRGIDSGLALARKNVLSKAGSVGMGDSSAVEGQQINLDSSFQKCICLRAETHGSNLTESDRKEISSMMKDFNGNSLIPFVERQLRTMNEQITARRGISRSLTSGVRKLFGAATIQSNGSSSVSYSMESSEMQTRRLADLCFIFGLYGYAYQLYQGLKKTFAIDQAWLHHASALDNDLYAGILLERSSAAFGKANMLRKMAFHYVLAGHRFFKAEQDGLALACYKTALTEYAHKRWSFAEDHILYILARDDKNSDAALQYSKELFRSISVQNEEQQEQFFSRFLELLVQTHKSDKIPLKLPESLINVEIVHAIYGDNPEQAFSELVRENFDERIIVSQGGILLSWSDLEKSCFRYFFGTSRKFSPSPFVTDAFADYSNTYVTPLNERLRIRVAVNNFSGLSFTLKKVCLFVDDCLDIEKSFIEEVILESHCNRLELEFSILPRKEMEKILIKGLSFGIKYGENVLDCQIFFKREQRKNSSDLERVQPISNFCCICSKVLSLPHPSFRVELSPIRHLSGFYGQICWMDFDVSNLGAVDIHGFCIATHRLSIVSIYESVSASDMYSWKLSEFQICSNDRNVLIFTPNIGVLSVGTKKKYTFATVLLRIAFRLPGKDVKNYSLPLLFYCTSGNGLYRQERHLILLDTHMLLSTSLCAVSNARDLCVLRVRNLITSRDSLLAKVQLLGIREIRSKPEQVGTLSSLKEDIVLKPLYSRIVLLECEQSDNFCFTIELRQSTKSQSVTWFFNSSEEFPVWPVIPNFSNSQSSTSCSSYNNLVNSQPLEYGILWKANIVNTDGTISNVIGENMVEFDHQLPTLESSDGPLLSNALGTAVTTTQAAESSSDGIGVVDEYSLFCNVKCNSSVISHDFSAERFCSFPVDIAVTNNDKMQRECELILLCKVPGESYLVDPGRNSQHDPQRTFSSTVSLAPSVVSMQFLPVTTQPLIMSNCARRHASVAFGSTHVFKVFLTVAASSVYNVTCFELSGHFQGSNHSFPIALPLTFVFVADKIAKNKW